MSSLTDEHISPESSAVPVGTNTCDGRKGAKGKPLGHNQEPSEQLQIAASALDELYKIHDAFFCSDKEEKRVSIAS